MNPIRKLLARSCLLAICMELVAVHAQGQSKGVPIEAESPSPPQSVVDQAAHLRDQGQLLQSSSVAIQLVTPIPGTFQPKAVLTAPLQPREIAERARASAVHIGWYYLCPDCNHWHTKLTGGYAVARNAVATGYHCVDPSKTPMSKGYLIAVDSEGTVRPVTAVLAGSQGMDAVILRVGGRDLQPLALNDAVAQGDAAFCLSDPLGNNGYFSQGIVSRFFWMRGRKGNPGSLDELACLRMNVSTEWAPGSSGAAVLDLCGNAIGHVANISPLKEKGHPSAEKPAESKEESVKNEPQASKTATADRFQGAVLITMHIAIPARSVMALVQGINPTGFKTRQ